MTEEESKKLAAQLRKPSGDVGLEVGRFMNKGNELLNRNTINLITPKSDINVVELGMGNGKFIDELFVKFPDMKYVGCDYSEEMVEAANALNTEKVNSGKVIIYHCDADQLPLHNESIDVIFTVNTIYFWPDVENILQEFIRVLKPGGQLLIGLRPAHLMKHYPFVKFGFVLFTANQIEQHLTEQGFISLESTTVKEPDFVTDGLTFPVESLIVKGIKR